MSWEKDSDEGAADFASGEFKRSEEKFASAVSALKGDKKHEADYASALEWLGRTRIWLAKYDEAETDLQESRDVKERVYGPDSTEVAMTDLYRSDLDVAREMYPEAHQLASSAFLVIQKERSANDLMVADAATRVGVAAAYLNKPNESEPMLTKALGIRRGNLGENHRLVAESLDNLAMSHCLAENYTMAGALGRKALLVGEATLGTNHPEVGVTLLNLTTQYLRSSMYEKAEPVARRGAEILGKLPKENALNIRMSDRLATTCLAKGNLDEAEELHKRALSNAENVWGPDHPNVVPSLVGLGSTYLNKNDYKNAEYYFNRSLKVMEKCSEIDATQEYRLIQNLSCAYILQLKVPEALRLIPASFRAKHTSDFSSTLDLIRKIVEFIGKQVKGYRQDRGDF